MKRCKIIPRKTAMLLMNVFAPVACVCLARQSGMPFATHTCGTAGTDTSAKTLYNYDAVA